MGILDESLEPESLLDAPSTWIYFIELLRPIISKVVLALLFLLIGFILGKLVGKTVHWVLRKMNLNKYFHQITGMNARLESFLSGFVSILVYVGAIVMVLNVLGLSQIIVKILSFGLICLIFISLFLAVKDFVLNYLHGIRLHKRIKLKDVVLIDTIKGKVEEITWTDMKIIAENGDILYIPHRLFLTKGFRKIS